MTHPLFLITGRHMIPFVVERYLRESEEGQRALRRLVADMRVIDPEIVETFQAAIADATRP